MISVILLAFIFPYLCMISLEIFVESKIESVKHEATSTYMGADETLSKALKTIDSMFKLSALRKAESLADTAAIIISTKRSNEESSGHGEEALPVQERLMELVRNSRVGEESRLSIIDPYKDLIIADVYLESGEAFHENLPQASRLIREKEYIKILENLSGNALLVGNVGTVSDSYYIDENTMIKGALVGKPVLDAEKEKEGIKSDGKNMDGNVRQKVFAIATPIKGTSYSLVVTALISGLTRQVLTQIQDSRELINGNLSKTEAEFSSVENTGHLVLALGFLFGVLIVVLLFVMTKKQIVDPVRDLMWTTDSIRKGNYRHRVRLSTLSGDFMELGLAINRMLDTITELIGSEEDKKRLQENIIYLLEVVSQAAEGNLTGRGRVSEDVLGSVTDAFNVMLDSMSGLIVEVKSSGQRVTMSASSILNASQKISVESKRQGHEIHKVTSMVQQASRSMQRVSISSDMANEESQRATIAARDGARKVNETIQSMQRIRSNVQATSKTIKMLGDRSLEINAIVEMINDISARTNILSLNAAIEASKAGEQGKGFAVVADEIRKLADRTTNATKEISSFIEDIQIETNDAVLAMEEVTREVELGWKQSDQAGTTLRQIRNVVSSAAEKTSEISSVSSEMVTQMDAVVEDIKSIYQITRETTDAILRSSSETKGLLTPLRELNKVIHSFRLHPKFEQEMQMRWIIPAIGDVDGRETDGEGRSEAEDGRDVMPFPVEEPDLT